MKKFLKFGLRVFLFSMIFSTIAAIGFSLGFAARPDVYDKLPAKIQQLIGPEQSQVSRKKFNTLYNNRLLLGVFDTGTEEVNPEDLKTLMRGDLNWVIDIRFNQKLGEKIRPKSAVNGEISWYTTIADPNQPKARSSSKSYIDKRGAPITELTFILPEGEFARIVTITLFAPEDYKVNIMKNELRFPDGATPDAPPVEPTDPAEDDF